MRESQQESRVYAEGLEFFPIHRVERLLEVKASCQEALSIFKTVFNLDPQLKDLVNC